MVCALGAAVRARRAACELVLRGRSFVDAGLRLVTVVPLTQSGSVQLRVGCKAAAACWPLSAAVCSISGGQFVSVLSGCGVAATADASAVYDGKSCCCPGFAPLGQAVSTSRVCFGGTCAAVSGVRSMFSLQCILAAGSAGAVVVGCCSTARRMSGRPAGRLSVSAQLQHLHGGCGTCMLSRGGGSFCALFVLLYSWPVQCAPLPPGQHRHQVQLIICSWAGNLLDLPGVYWCRATCVLRLLEVSFVVGQVQCSRQCQMLLLCAD